MNLLVERGVFENEESLATSAYRSLLMLQPELKVEIALSLYQTLFHLNTVMTSRAASQILPVR
jgi:hypothetical protein